MAKNIIIGVFVFLLLSFGLIGFNALMPVFVEIPTDSPIGRITINIEDKISRSDFGKILLEKKIVSSDILFATEAKNVNLEIYAGDYILELPAKRTDLIAQIQKQSKNDKEEISVLFREGQTLDQYADILDKKKVVSAKEFKEYAINPNNFDRIKFPFLPKPLQCQYGDIQKCAKYYPEGYLYPSTYKFYTNSNPKKVYDKILKEGFEANVWSKIKDKANDLDKKMIIASVLERETGRPIEGVNNSNSQAVAKERAIISGIFQNRITQKIKWQSNPTATYGLGGNLCEKTLKSDDNKCYTLKSPEVANLYNTYQIASYPIGPISNPSIDNILASLNPEKSDYLFFVSEAGGEMYYANTGTGHSENIAKASKINEKYR